MRILLLVTEIIMFDRTTSSRPEARLGVHACVSLLVSLLSSSRKRFSLSPSLGVAPGLEWPGGEGGILIFLALDPNI